MSDVSEAKEAMNQAIVEGEFDDDAEVRPMTRTERWIEAQRLAQTNDAVFTHNPEFAAAVLMRESDQERTAAVAEAMKPIEEAMRLMRISRRALHMALDHLGDPAPDKAAPTPENIEHLSEVYQAAYEEVITSIPAMGEPEPWDTLDEAIKQAIREGIFAVLSAVRR